MVSIVWFRHDLRLSDNPALAAAVARGQPVVPLFILDDVNPAPWQPGGASSWWLHHSLAALQQDLALAGVNLVLRRGNPQKIIDGIIQDMGATAVFWNRTYQPWAVQRDEVVKRVLKARGLHVESFNASLLREPWEVKKADGRPYMVFSPYWKALQQLDIPAPLPVMAGLPPAPPVGSDRLEDWELLPKPDWAAGFRATWKVGEAAAQAKLQRFLDANLFDYGESRNIPSTPGTSTLSPHLHWGEISPRQVWQQTQTAMAAEPALQKDGMKFLAEIAWREFSYNLLWQFPQLPTTELRPEFRSFPWENDPQALQKWQRGQTGYPIVDAGMRQLWQTGWMHNRVRMIVASFLIKDLLIDWRVGQAWFWDTLVDADLASNSASWQWVAGCGADAAPYFRVFNPVLQAQKFDPAGEYVRRWVPEVAHLPDNLIHCPWEAGSLFKGKTGYPSPIVDHSKARDRALAIFAGLKKRDAAGEGVA